MAYNFRGKTWTKEDRQTLETLWKQNVLAKIIAAELDRSIGAVTKERYRMELNKRPLNPLFVKRLAQITMF